MATYQELTEGSPDGCHVGQSTSDKIAFYGVTPVVQPTGAVAVATTLSVSAAPFGFSTSTQANAIVTAVNVMKAALTTLGLTS